MLPIDLCAHDNPDSIIGANEGHRLHRDLLRPQQICAQAEQERDTAERDADGSDSLHDACSIRELPRTSSSRDTARGPRAFTISSPTAGWRSLGFSETSRTLPAPPRLAAATAPRKSTSDQPQLRPSSAVPIPREAPIQTPHHEFALLPNRVRSGAFGGRRRGSRQQGAHDCRCQHECSRRHCPSSSSGTAKQAGRGRLV